MCSVPKIRKTEALAGHPDYVMGLGSSSIDTMIEPSTIISRFPGFDPQLVTNIEFGKRLLLNLPEALVTPPGSVESVGERNWSLEEELEEPEFSTTINDLFPEVLLEIFKKLTVKELGNVARTCRRWNAIVNDNKCLWRGIEAKIHLKNGSNRAMYQCLNRRGIRDVQVLSLRRRLSELTSSVPDIRSLKISGCYSVSDWTLSNGFATKMENLSHLNLSLCKQISDVSLGQIITAAKNLQTLELGGCSQITNRGLLLISMGLKKLTQLNLRSCYLITDTGVGFLAGVVHPIHLQDPRTNDFLVKLGLLDPPPVPQIPVQGSSSVRRAEDLMYRRQEVSAGGSGPLPLSRPTSQPHHPPTVPVKKYRYDSSGNPMPANAPQQCAICKQDIPVYDPSSQYASSRSSKRSRGADGMPGTSRRSSSSIYKVYGSSSHRDNADPEAMDCTSVPPPLEKITSETQFGNKNLQLIVLQDCQKLSDDCLAHLTNLPRLETINLSFCVHITDVGMRHLGNCPSLKEVILRACDTVTDIGLAHLAHELSPRLTSLDVSFCPKVRNSSLSHLAVLSKLKTLFLSACSISDEGLIKIVSSVTQLETLNIGQCSKITDASLKVIAEKCQELKYIDLYGCGNITTKGIDMITKLPKLKHLNLGLWNLR